MGIKRVRPTTQNDTADQLSAPPGFASLTSFRLRKIESRDQNCNSVDLSYGEIDDASIKVSLPFRPWILDCQNVQNQEGKSDSEPAVTIDLPSGNFLPRGVAHGCPDCNNCQKVVARWRPEEARKVVLDEAPTFYPTEEEFKDTLNYIESIHPKVVERGICRIVPPLTWEPPFLFSENNIRETSKFATHIQRVDGLQNHYVQEKIDRIYENGRSKGRKHLRLDSENGVASGCTNEADEVGCSDSEGFESDTGREFTLETFKKYADDFKSRYFCISEEVVGSEADPTVNQERLEPSLDNIEGEYRRIVENPTEEIEVLYGGELDTRVFSSGFPTKPHSEVVSDHNDYVISGWNLNNTPKLPGSLLSFERCKTSDVLVPRMKIGTCFSSTGWKVEEHHLYSLCYLHLGAPKIWYAIPGRYSVKFEAVLKKYLGDKFVEQPQLQDRMVSRLSLSILKSEGIPVYRGVLYPREFVLVLPGAYYSGFDSGFNCAETVNFASIDWLPHGQYVVELYSGKRRKTSLSHDKLLLGVAREVVRAQWEISLLRKNSPDTLRWKSVCGKDGILVKVFKSRMISERNKRKFLCTSSESQKMDQNFDAMIKRECCICFYDLHISAVRCQCSADRYACLNHSTQLCCCPWSKKSFLFRYEISELKTILEALEGKLSAIYRCAREVFNLSLFDSISDSSSPRLGCAVDIGSTKIESQKKHEPQRSLTPSSTVLSIKEEIKARVLSKTLDEQKHKKEKKVEMLSSSLVEQKRKEWIKAELLSRSSDAQKQKQKSLTSELSISAKANDLLKQNSSTSVVSANATGNDPLLLTSTGNPSKLLAPDTISISSSSESGESNSSSISSFLDSVGA